MKTKKILALLSALIILAAGLYAVIHAYINLPPTFDGTKIDVEALYNDPDSAVVSSADGAAAVIVMKNLTKTYAANDVASIVFDFRGYDTLGESFILLTAIAGSFVILARHKASGKEEEQHEV